LASMLIQRTRDGGDTSVGAHIVESQHFIHSCHPVLNIRLAMDEFWEHSGEGAKRRCHGLDMLLRCCS
ncbi:hypothetical protein CLOP_g22430, partial [Closterium sp. NIES-67]